MSGISKKVYVQVTDLVCVRCVLQQLQRPVHAGRITLQWWVLQVAVTQGDDETELTGFCPEAKVTCKAAAVDQLKSKLVAEITKSWAEHRQQGWADPVPNARRPEADIESDYANDFVVCVLDIKVQV